MNTPSLKWLFFSFRGRIARQSFLLSTFFLLLPQFYIFSRLIQTADNSASEISWGLIWVFVSLLSLWSALAIATKRLHDLGLPGILAVVMALPSINFIAFVVLSILPSKNETNQYGPPPFGKR